MCRRVHWRRYRGTWVYPPTSFHEAGMMILIVKVQTPWTTKEDDVEDEGKAQE